MRDPCDDLVRGFAEACRGGDIVALCGILAADVIAVSDSGGRLPAALDVLHGAQDVARLAVVLLGALGDTELSVEAVNGRAGLALRRAGQALAVVGIDGGRTRITALWIVLNTDKLRGWHR
jgi:RNA polymerase sigma-70 factor (ECF subfamily)